MTLTEVLELLMVIFTVASLFYLVGKDVGSNNKKK